MALPNVFTQTPIEAAIWTAAVGMQTEVARAIKSTPIFWGVVALAIGLGFIAYLLRMGSGARPIFGTSKFLLLLGTIAAGVSFLTYQNTTAFSPVNSHNTEWRNIPKVARNDKYSALQNPPAGLFWYTTIHRGLAEVGDLLTSIVGFVSRDPYYKDAPQYLMNALASTARVTIDDPEIARTFDELAARCANTSQGQILDPSSSLKTLFNMSDPWCQTKYALLNTQLRAFAVRNRPATLSLGAHASEILSGMGLTSQAAIDNKIIASSVKNYAKLRAGESFRFHNTNAAALIGETDFWVNLSKSFSSSSFLSLVNAGRDLFGMETRDLEGAALRNEAAVTYNQLLSVLPAARGYAKAFLAFAFIFASLGLCVGASGYFFGWLKMAAIFTLYEPLSASLYAFTTKLITSTENIKALDALRVDPMVLIGADIVDANLARIQLVYFCVQVALLLTCAVAGIRAFGTIRSLKNSYLSDLFGSVSQGLSVVSHAKTGFGR